MSLHKQLKNVCVRTPGSLVMALVGLSALLFVPTAPEILAETKKKGSTLPLAPHCPIRAFTQCHLKYGLLWHGYYILYHFSNRNRKRMDRLEV